MQGRVGLAQHEEAISVDGPCEGKFGILHQVASIDDAELVLGC